MSIFALNMKFDIEEARATHNNQQFLAEIDQKINRTQKGQLRNRQIQTIITNQERKIMREHQRVQNEYLQKIINEKDELEEEDYPKEMSEKEKMYYKFLKNKRERQSFQL